VFLAQVNQPYCQRGLPAPPDKYCGYSIQHNTIKAGRENGWFYEIKLKHFMQVTQGP
jgi:hypothetical protein